MTQRLKTIFTLLKKNLRPKGAPFYVFLAIMFSLLVIFTSNFFAGQQGSVFIPDEFMLAREDAAAVGREIVTLTSSTNEKIRKVNLLDIQGGGERIEKAINLVREAKDDNAEALSNAFELSEHLQRLAESLIRVSPVSSQRVAYEAIAVELSLVSEFIQYTKNLNEFLDSLERSIALRSTFEEQDIIGSTLDEVNQNTQTINQLNEEFLVRMRQFDQSL
ncbi:hypothetical protein CL629_04245 [bacterium]|nr:hypothetical protein [bacterium]|tara:strand:+ start:13612 stop:14268 length:657 start_codon:yes stop_codon:yes gene_type:complete